MRKTNKKSRLFLKVSILATTLLIVTLSFNIKNEQTSREDQQTEEVPPVMLNEIITNEMSELEELNGLDRTIKNYLRDWHIKGASLAIMRNDSLVYAKGYGWADEEKGIAMEPGHILRVASVSKLITATGIMVMQDKGMLTIDDQVFGEDGILNDQFFTDLTDCDPNYKKITVEHLLRHQGGFYRDPLFSSADVQKQLRLDHTPTKEDFFGLVLSRKLRAVPGTLNKYSNFGYLLLSEIIEKVSGMSYEDFIKKNVLEPAGCYDMHIAEIYYEDKRDNEVRYYTHEGDGRFMEEFNLSGRIVERCYGGSNTTLLSGAGAWVASPVELARLVASIDGDDTVKDIISHESFLEMIEYFDQNTYSLGWNDTDPNKGWKRTGTLAGTSALVKRYPDGECWIMVTNTSTYKGPGFTNKTDALFQQCRASYSSKLPQRSMFE